MRTNSTLDEVGARQELALAQHHRDHRRHRGEPGAAIAPDRLDIGARGELRQQHDRRMRRAGELRERQRVHVIERRRDEIAVARRSWPPSRVSTTQIWLWCDSTTPLGVPVEPEV